MAKHLLLKSTIVSAAIHYAAIMVYQPHPLYSLFLTVCLLSSLANHSLTVPWARPADRLIISAAVPVTYIILLGQPSAVPIYLMVGPAAAATTYLLSKSFMSVWLHFVAHILITATNVGVMKLKFWSYPA
jgi:hypothetical protein